MAKATTPLASSARKRNGEDGTSRFIRVCSKLLDQSVEVAMRCCYSGRPVPSHLKPSIRTADPVLRDKMIRADHDERRECRFVIECANRTRHLVGGKYALRMPARRVGDRHCAHQLLRVR